MSFQKTTRIVVLATLLAAGSLFAQGATSSAIMGRVLDSGGKPMLGARVVAVHVPSRTVYHAQVTDTGHYHLTNMRPGEPYAAIVVHTGFKILRKTKLKLNLGETITLDFTLSPLEMKNGAHVTAQEEPTFGSGRIGATTWIAPLQIDQLPSLNRSSRDLLRLEPSADGNFSFGGRSWLNNNLTVDGSYFINMFDADNPIPGGQADAQALPIDAIDHIQISAAPFNVARSGFTGADVNMVTRSGNNTFSGAAYTFLRGETLVGSELSGLQTRSRDLSFKQTGFTVSGPLIESKLFFFANGELERGSELASDFVASRSGSTGPGISRVQASDLEAIRERMFQVYNYDTGPFENYTSDTNNEKFLIKLDWNRNKRSKAAFRYNYLGARQDRLPEPFAITINNSGRGPSANSLPFRSAGYEINNRVHSFTAEMNSWYEKYTNRFFSSFTALRAFRDSFSEPFPLLEIAADGITYTSLGHEPFSVNNSVDQNIWQFGNELSFSRGKHFISTGLNFEVFSFSNSFNLFYHGLHFLPPNLGGTSFSSLEEFFDVTDPNSPNFRSFNDEVDEQQQEPFRQDKTRVGQFGLHIQDEFAPSESVNLTLGVRIDFPIYFTDIPENNFSKSLRLRDNAGNPEFVDASKFPSARPLFSPRIGFNWGLNSERTTQIRGGSGLFTGRLPFIWVGNQVANQGTDPDLEPEPESSSLDINVLAPDFKWPQVWKTHLAIDRKLPGGVLGSLGLLYGQDINAVVVRNADLTRVERRLPGPDNRPYFGGPGNNKLNTDFAGGVFVLDNSSKGHSLNITAQASHVFSPKLKTQLGYNYSVVKSQLNSNGLARSLWAENPVQGDPNDPEVSFTEFGRKHRLIGSATYSKRWSERTATHIGFVFEAGDGDAALTTNRSRFSYVYAGDVNGDGSASNDLIYIPRSSSEINLIPILDDNASVISTPEEQWQALDAFIEQDGYLSAHRGEIAARNGALMPWVTTIDLRILQDLSFTFRGRKQALQLSLDLINIGNMFNSSWGVKSLPQADARSPLRFTGQFDEQGAPLFQFRSGAQETFVDDLGLRSRWQAQFGIRYLFN